MAVPASPCRYALVLCVFAALFGFTSACVIAKGDWADISSEDLQRTRPELSPDSSAEILFKETVISRSSRPLTDEYRVVVKIYSKVGVEEFSKIDLVHEPETRIYDVEARVLKADGTKLVLQSKDIYEREFLDGDGTRMKVKSFAPPGLEVGDILEYHFTEVSPWLEGRMSLFFQSRHPARLVRFKVKPFPSLSPKSALRSLALNCPNVPLKKNGLGYFVFEQANVPAVKEEPLQPPKLDTQIAMLLYYSPDDERDPLKFWKKHSEHLFTETENSAFANHVVKSRLAEIVKPDDSAMAKLQKIHDYCRTNILNRHRSAARALKKEGTEWKRNYTASDVLTQGNGSKADINRAFVALARAAGFDARLALCNNRNLISFSLVGADRRMLPDTIAAVWIDSRWIFTAPGSTYLPFGVLSWRNSDAPVLVADKTGKGELLVIRGLSHERSVRKRDASFTLDSEGTLEGDVDETYTGLYEDKIKEEMEGLSATEKADRIKALMQKHQSMAELSDINVENAADPIQPVRIKYHLRIPQYADRSGRRLFIQPSVFQKSVPPLFEAEERRTNIAFHFRHTTQDNIRIRLPEGFRLEQASAPLPLALGAMGEFTTRLLFSKTTNEVVFTRSFAQKEVLFRSTVYKELKAAFEEVAARDAHTLTLLQSE